MDLYIYLAPMSGGSNTEFVKNVQKWVAIDTQLHELQEKMKQLREMKKEVATTIHKHVEENHMEKTVIHISDGELRFCEKKEYSGLTLGYIEECLKECLDKESVTVDNIMQYIREKRVLKTVKDIARKKK